MSPAEPRNDTGVYWGYSVRIAKSLSDVFLKSPYENGYDLTIGTSDKGDSIHDVTADSLSYNHALIVYGGLQGLESALETDDKLDVEDPSLLFNHYLNTVPCQGLYHEHHLCALNAQKVNSCHCHRIAHDTDRRSHSDITGIVARETATDNETEGIQLGRMYTAE